ncbi:MAG TPA: hypothetical protein VN229_15300 [Terriglobales bacterium]|nr:hypothetical protein [Terriglobales bacterium]
MTFLTVIDPISRQPAAGAYVSQRRRALLPFLLLASLAAAPAFADQSTPAASQQSSQQSSQAAAHSQAPLTFPPSNDCSFLGGDAGKRCEARRAGHESEFARVRSGEIKMAPGVPSSSGGEFAPLSSGGSLSGYSSSGTIAPSGESSMPSSGRSFSPNSIGNPWAGTPYDQGTGMMPR